MSGTPVSFVVLLPRRPPDKNPPACVCDVTAIVRLPSDSESSLAVTMSCGANHWTTSAEAIKLFELKEDCRPAAKRTAAGRYAEPTLLDRMHDG
jgi:hypothetical protein